jgi:hypothetical protein
VLHPVTVRPVLHPGRLLAMVLPVALRPGRLLATVLPAVLRPGRLRLARLLVMALLVAHLPAEVMAHPAAATAAVTVRPPAHQAEASAGLPVGRPLVGAALPAEVLLAVIKVDSELRLRPR